MKRSGVAKFPHSVQLFKFCQKVLTSQKGVKVHDQEVGNILSFNPSDCSHWKRGEKNVKSVFALARLAEALNLEVSLIHDVASGGSRLEEAYFEYQEASSYQNVINRALEGAGPEGLRAARRRVEAFVADLQAKADFSSPPLYFPEILRFFPMVLIQPMDMMDRLSRILRKKPGQYIIHYAKGELRPQTRMSMTRDLARIIFQAERQNIADFGEIEAHLCPYEELAFTAELLVPKKMLLAEIDKLDSRRNLLAELASLFWVPKSLVGFQIQELVRSSATITSARVADSQRKPLLGELVREDVLL